MRHNRIGATILLMENLPELHDNMTTKWWRKRARFVGGPARRAVDNMILEMGNVLYVLGFATALVGAIAQAIWTVISPVVPYALIATVIASTFYWIFY